MSGKNPCYRLYTLLIVVLLHIASVVVTELKKGGSLVSAMLTGKKILPGSPKDGGGSP